MEVFEDEVFYSFLFEHLDWKKIEDEKKRLRDEAQRKKDEEERLA